MNYKVKFGDLFDTKCMVIAHQVNCMGVMGSGVAKTVKLRYPKVFEAYESIIDLLDGVNCLGNCQLVPTYDGKYIANLFSQYLFGGYMTDSSITPWISPFGVTDSNSKYQKNFSHIKFTNYEAFYRCLIKLRNEMNRLELTSVAFPYKIGSDRGGADWNIIESMIVSVFKDTKFDVVIYKISLDEGEDYCPKCKSILMEMDPSSLQPSGYYCPDCDYREY